MGRAEVRKHQPRHVLGRCFSNRAGDRRDKGLRARARIRAEALQRGLRILDDEKRTGGREVARMRFVHDGGRRALFEGRGNEIMSVARVAIDGEKQIAGLQRARIDGDAARLARQTAPAHAGVERADEAESGP